MELFCRLKFHTLDFEWVISFYRSPNGTAIFLRLCIMLVHEQCIILVQQTSMVVVGQQTEGHVCFALQS